MKSQLCLLLLAVSISAAPQRSSLAELLTTLEQTTVAEDIWNLRVETPDNIDDVNCVQALFEGAQQLKASPAVRKHSLFFQRLEILKHWLPSHLGTEGQCETERRNAGVFLAKLRTFIRKALKTTTEES